MVKSKKTLVGTGKLGLQTVACTNKDRRRELTILSWNIHDSMTKDEGPKSEDTDFAQILNKATVFCLQETKQQFFLPNFKCFNSNRVGSRSGGVCIGVHRSFVNNINVIDTGCPDFQAMTIYPHDEDLRFTIINVYDSPEHSSYKRKLKTGGDQSETALTTLDLVQEFKAKHQNLGEILLLGDLNARIGPVNPVFEDEVHETEYLTEGKPASHPEPKERASKDVVVNSRGRLLLDFLSCSGLQVLNGRVLGDVFGEYTSVNYNGCSVVDYMTVTATLIDKVEHFKVLDLTKFSDHKPCTCKLKIQNSFQDADELLENLEDAPIKYTWDHEDQSAHYHFLAIQNLPEYRERISDIANRQCNTKEEIESLNGSLVEVYQNMADKLTGRDATTSRTHRLALSKGPRRRKRPKMKPKAVWFDAECIEGKRSLNRLAKRYGKTPTDQSLRETYYNMRRLYRALVRRKKRDFILNLCKDIEEGKNINWNRFKKLRDTNKKSQQLDVFDMKNFCEFFKKLYGQATLSSQKISQLQSAMGKDTLRSDLIDILDKEITLQEVEDCISSTKKRKAVSEDLIANEFLKSSGSNLKKAILNVFNHCLTVGAYPWNTSVVTPLHKKGSIYDPNNYRAIAVASNLGKLFSSILLKRLICFRNIYNPDTQNQLGFCQNAMTSDHILTLNTCIESTIKKSKKRLYSCFVDYAKAFDTVCREALLYKLWKLGIQGKYFNCLQHMYSNSSAKIKLLKKLSEKIDVLCGTEQGHPMSPELFKCFVHQLSEDLNNLDDVEVPALNSQRVTHLLWADDLVLLALNPESLQKMLDVLYSYCMEWGLTVNISKTAVMVFNRAGRLLKESHTFSYGNTMVPSAREYTYLGIVFTLSGSPKRAQTALRQKAMRSYFSLKNMVDLNSLNKEITFKLFDALIVPVAAYGCQIWLPYTNLFKTLSTSPGLTPALSKLAQDPLERVHLTFLKWTLNVGKYTSNAAIWGDSGRYPLAVELTEQVYSYLERLERMDTENSTAFVRHALVEQRSLELSWYSNLKAAEACISHLAKNNSSTPQNTKEALRSLFIMQWKNERHHNQKLHFYNSVKSSFGCETYLRVELNHQQLRRLAQIRTSSHRFNVETGRHGPEKRSTVLNRVCHHCSDTDTLKYMLELPFQASQVVVEDELHVLQTCPRYKDLREQMSELANTYLNEDPGRLFTEQGLILQLAKFLVRVNNRRFPKKRTDDVPGNNNQHYCSKQPT